METWRRLDSRITYPDIVDRQTDDPKYGLRKLSPNALQNHCGRKCRKLIGSWLEYNRRVEPHKTDVENIAKLTYENILHNTFLNVSPEYPSRIAKLRLCRKFEADDMTTSYYTEVMEVTEENMLKTSYPIDYFLTSRPYFNSVTIDSMTPIMHNALELLLRLQERADLHGITFWEKLPRPCLPDSWFDRVKHTTRVPNVTYDGGCHICSFETRLKALEVRNAAIKVTQATIPQIDNAQGDSAAIEDHFFEPAKVTKSGLSSNQDGNPAGETQSVAPLSEDNDLQTTGSKRKRLTPHFIRHNKRARKYVKAVPIGSINDTVIAAPPRKRKAHRSSVQRNSDADARHIESSVASIGTANDTANNAADAAVDPAPDQTNASNLTKSSPIVRLLESYHPPENIATEPSFPVNDFDLILARNEHDSIHPELLTGLDPVQHAQADPFPHILGAFDPTKTPQTSLNFETYDDPSGLMSMPEAVGSPTLEVAGRAGDEMACFTQPADNLLPELKPLDPAFSSSPLQDSNWLNNSAASFESYVTNMNKNDSNTLIDPSLVTNSYPSNSEAYSGGDSRWPSYTSIGTGESLKGDSMWWTNHSQEVNPEASDDVDLPTENMSGRGDQVGFDTESAVADPFTSDSYFPSSPLQEVSTINGSGAGMMTITDTQIATNIASYAYNNPFSSPDFGMSDVAGFGTVGFDYMASTLTKTPGHLSNHNCSIQPRQLNLLKEPTHSSPQTASMWDIQPF